MRNKVSAGIVAGLIAGLPFGIMMQLMQAPTPEGNRVPMMMMVAMVVQSESLLAGWLYHLFNSGVIGGLFGVLLGTAADANTSRSVVLGTAWGVVWWIVGALILMPLLLGMPAFAALRMPPMRPVAMGSLVGHLIYGVILGLAYARLRQGGQMEASAEVRAARGR